MSTTTCVFVEKVDFSMNGYAQLQIRGGIHIIFFLFLQIYVVGTH